MRNLTPRQKEVLTLLAKGLSTKEIAKELTLSENVVRNYGDTIRIRLDCQTTAQAVAKAVSEELINL